MLTAADVQRAPRCLNALGERQITLRHLAIDNLNGLKVCDDYQSAELDFNNIRFLQIPFCLPNLKSMSCNNNCISAVSDSIGRSIPNLERLSLAKNRLANIGALEFLKGLPKLRYVCFEENPVSRHAHYRLAIINAVKNIRWIDYTRVSEAERKEAANLKDHIDALILEEQAGSQNERNSTGKGSKDELLKRLASASTIEEIDELEALLAC